MEGICPSNTFLTKDDKEIVIAANGDAIFGRLMRAMDREDLATDTKLSSNQGRMKNVSKIENAISFFSKKHGFSDLVKILNAAGIPNAPIYDIADISRDEHFESKEVFQKVILNSGSSTRIPNIFPKMSRSPSKLNWTRRRKGENSHQILKQKLGYSSAQIRDSNSEGVIFVDND